MSDTAAHLVDHVLPEVAVRQWVLSVPPPLRYLLAWDTELCAAVVRLFVRAVLRHLAAVAKRRGVVQRLADAQGGAVCMVQRWGGSGNLNVHLHALVADGVFVAEPASDVAFRALPAPETAEIAAVAWDVCQRVVALLRKRGQWLDAAPEEDRLAQTEPLLAQLYGASITGTLVLGPKAGQRQMRLFGAPARGESEGVRVKNAYGFDVDASVRIPGHDRPRLERLARYMARPPLSKERLARQSDGTYRLTLKKPWRDGTTHIVLSGPELVGRLAALVPPPRFHLTRYFGVFAPRARLRRAVVPCRDAEGACGGAAAHGGPDRHGSRPEAPATPDTPGLHRRRMEWSRLLARVFAVDVLTCPRCSSRLSRLELCTRPERIRAVLATTGPPGEAKALA
jgi:hypothetical protein